MAEEVSRKLLYQFLQAVWDIRRVLPRFAPQIDALVWKLRETYGNTCDKPNCEACQCKTADEYHALLDKHMKTAGMTFDTRDEQVNIELMYLMESCQVLNEHAPALTTFVSEFFFDAVQAHRQGCGEPDCEACAATSMQDYARRMMGGVTPKGHG